MAQTNSYVMSTPGFVVDPHSIMRDLGRQIDWANVPASFVNASSGKKVIPAGTTVGVKTGSTAGVVPRSGLDPTVLGQEGETAVGILETQAEEDSKSAAVSGYGVIVGGHLFENALPDATGTPAVLPAAYKTELNDSGYAWRFRQYSDSRLS